MGSSGAGKTAGSGASNRAGPGGGDVSGAVSVPGRPRRSRRDATGRGPREARRTRSRCGVHHRACNEKPVVVSRKPRSLPAYRGRVALRRNPADTRANGISPLGSIRKARGMLAEARSKSKGLHKMPDHLLTGKAAARRFTGFEPGCQPRLCPRLGVQLLPPPPVSARGLLGRRPSLDPVTSSKGSLPVGSPRAGWTGCSLLGPWTGTSPCVCVLISSLPQDTGRIGLGPTLVTSL